MWDVISCPWPWYMILHNVMFKQRAILSKSSKFTSFRGLGQSYANTRASETTQYNMGNRIIWIHNKWSPFCRKRWRGNQLVSKVRIVESNILSWPVEMSSFLRYKQTWENRSIILLKRCGPQADVIFKNLCHRIISSHCRWDQCYPTDSRWGK